MKSFQNEKAIEAYRFVKFSKENTVETATAGTDNIIGINDGVFSDVNDVTDVALAGEIAEILSGGSFSAGDALTSDAEGKAVKATSADNIGAIALQDATEGDVINALVVNQRVISE